MTAKQYINHSYPVLKPNDTVEKALLLMSDFKINYLPLVSDFYLEGFYSEEVLLNFDNEIEIKNLPPLDPQPVVSENEPLLEIIRKAYLSASEILAVLDTENKFSGIIEKQEIYKSFVESLSLYNEGAILEIKIKKQDYSLQDITRIVEAESAKIISLFTSRESYEEVILTVKLDINNISSIINTLERFDYDVVSYHSHEQVNNLEKDRYDLLMKYLSI